MKVKKFFDERSGKPSGYRAITLNYELITMNS